MIGKDVETGARNIRNRIGAARVLGQRVACIVCGLPLFIENDVFQDGSPSRNGLVDVRLSFFRKLYDLSVAAALKIIKAVARPAMLIVADQDAVRIG